MTDNAITSAGRCIGYLEALTELNKWVSAQPLGRRDPATMLALVAQLNVMIKKTEEAVNELPE